MIDRLFKNLDDVYDEIVEIRRHLHENPELSFQETNTAKLIADYQEKLGHEVYRNVGGNGVVAYLRGDKPGPTVALRADFDALPIQEETDVPFRSKVDGVMHACGHDGHTATLLGLAKALNEMKKDLAGTVVFIHQHAEEVVPGGAKSMIEAGCLDGVDAIFGVHLQAEIPLGEIQYRVGGLMAAADFFEIHIQGQGGHGGYPHQTKDSIVIGSELVGHLQHIVSRKVNPLKPAVVSIGTFEAVNANNIIADTAVLKGTVRTYDDEVREQIEKEIKKIIDHTCSMYDAKGTLEYRHGYPPVINHEAETQLAADLAHDIPGVERVTETEPVMSAEDFAYYLQKVKGSFIFVGAKHPTREFAYSHHHPKFDFDERAMLIAAKLLGKTALAYLDKD